MDTIPPDRNLTRIDFIFISKEHLVQFTGHEQLVCNGKRSLLQQSLINRTAQITEPTSTLAGETFHCTYSAGKNPATLAFIVPSAPVLRLLQGQAQQPRRANTVVAYQAQSEQHAAIAAITSKEKAIAQLNTPKEGQATLDTRLFPAEAYTIVLTGMLAFPIRHTGTLFASLQGRGNRNYYHRRNLDLKQESYGMFQTCI